MLKLRISGDDTDGIWLVEPKISVGRAASNNLVIDDPEVDDCHIEIFAKGDELIIHRRSDASTIVNGQKLGVKARLAANDQIILGNTQLEVIDPKISQVVTMPQRNEDLSMSTNSIQIAEPGEGWQLQSSHSGLTRSTYDVSDGMIIGRAKECDIVILLAHLSRRHAQFKIVGNNRLEITDLNSSNGTFVNGEQITTAILSDGDEVRFDTLPFSVVGPVDDLDKTMVRSASADELQAQMAKHMEQQEAMEREAQLRHEQLQAQREEARRAADMEKSSLILEDLDEGAQDQSIASSSVTPARSAVTSSSFGDDFDLDNDTYEPMYTTTAKSRRMDSMPEESEGSIVAIGVISTVLLIGTIGLLFF